MNPDNKGKQVWNASIYPDTGSALKDNSYICMTGKEGGDVAGVDVNCEPINETFYLSRDIKNALHIVSKDGTWTSASEKCKIVRDWWAPHEDQKNTRRRETECRFDCKIDWSKPPTVNIV